MALLDERDGHRVDRQPVDEVGGAVEGIDDPLVAAGPGDLASLLGQDAVIGEAVPQEADDQRLGPAVDLGDEVDGARLAVDRADAVAVLAEIGAGAPGGLDGGGAKGVLHRTPSVARPPLDNDIRARQIDGARCASSSWGPAAPGGTSGPSSRGRGRTSRSWRAARTWTPSARGFACGRTSRANGRCRRRRWNAPTACPPADLVLFCVKSFDTETAAEVIRPVVGPATGVLSIQNGVDNEDSSPRGSAPGTCIGGRGPGVRHHRGAGRDPAHPARPPALRRDGRGGDARACARFHAACARAGIPAEIVPDDPAWRCGRSTCSSSPSPA